VAPRVYATADDYRNWTGDLTAAALPAQLRAASARLDNALRGVYYATDEDGLPLDLDVEEAMRDAVCAIVAYWEETGDTTGSGAGAEFQSASIGTASYTRGYSKEGSAAGSSGGRLPQTAADIISAAGLRIVSPVIYG
jgi:hypothetical protein